ncbi:MAG: 16S rRNA (uracil(1498)-N(3))-methyltransferase [Cyanobacteria bacterium J06554_3]
MVQRITISAAQLKEGAIWLRDDQQHYLCRVLRLSAGAKFIAQDGEGRQWLAQLAEASGNEISASEASRNRTAALPSQAQILNELATTAVHSAPIRLVAALPKGNSFDEVVRQTTELGVTHIYPVISDRTLLKPSDNKLVRWRRIATEASEQSERGTVPTIFPPERFRTLLTHADWGGHRYICAARQQSPHLLSQLQIDLMSGESPAVNLMVGPEGGWTSAEITDAIALEYKVVTLGPAILRAVTAPVTALSLIAAVRELLT